MENTVCSAFEIWLTVQAMLLKTFYYILDLEVILLGRFDQLAQFC